MCEREGKGFSGYSWFRYNGELCSSALRYILIFFGLFVRTAS